MDPPARVVAESRHRYRAVPRPRRHRPRRAPAVGRAVRRMGGCGGGGMIGEWVTPRGAPVSMEFRDGTNDWNTLSIIFTNDEYGLRDLRLDGIALDVGAYLGGVAIALALDNPGLRVIAIEPVPDNGDLIERNITRNSVQDRVTLIRGAVGRGGESTDVRYG